MGFKGFFGKGGKKLDKKESQELAAKTNFDKAELDELHKEFLAMDADNSGELDLGEFKQLMAKRMDGATDEQLTSLFTSFDADGGGTVSFKELGTSLSILGKGTVEEKLTYMFEMYDADKSGSLEGDEVDAIVGQMKAIAAALGRDPAQAQSFIDGIMKKLDKDGDKEITKQEWVDQGKSTPSLLMLLGVN
jgi:serine/threonine-protein phosphatase 2B regulatory subunit